MRNLFRKTFWFGSADEAASENATNGEAKAESIAIEAEVEAEVEAVVEAEVSPSLPTNEPVGLPADKPTVETTVVNDPAPMLTPAPATAVSIEREEPVRSPESEVAAEAPAPVPAVILEQAPTRERGPEIKLSVRGARHYAICPGCEATWSLRDRLFDPRTGRPADLEALVCPMCTAPVSLPAGTDVRSIK